MPSSPLPVFVLDKNNARIVIEQKIKEGSTVGSEPGAALVMPVDLHGFWDMVFMQVDAAMAFWIRRPAASSQSSV
ncbi:unnamed protein product, partial [Iphiclides podalirius]